jgi:hypothetical protein
VNKIKECISKNKLRCIYFTKENKDELLKEVEPNIYNNKYDFLTRETDDYICIDFCGAYKTFYYYNHWYVEEEHDYEYPKFYCYLKEEFNDKYNLNI